MYARKEDNTIKEYVQLPKVFGRHLDFRSSSKAAQEKEGFYPLISPPLTATQQKGRLLKVPFKKQYTYSVVVKTLLTQDEIEIQNTANRKALLETGVDVNDNGEDYHFTEETLNNFITATQLSREVGLPVVKWKTATGDWIELPIAEAFTIAASGMQLIQQIYIDN